MTDSLDLHTFRPRDAADVTHEFVLAAQAAGLASVRIIHGKGTGTLRTIVHAVLAKHPAVRSYRLSEDGNWGATTVELAPPPA